MDFILPHVYILDKNNCAGKWHDVFVSRHNKFDWKYTCDCAEICQVLSTQFNSQYFFGCKSISMEGVVIEHFNILKPSTRPVSQFSSSLSDKIDQDSSTTTTNIFVFI